VPAAADLAAPVGAVADESIQEAGLAR
jgi:hypothetical protein